MQHSNLNRTPFAAILLTLASWTGADGGVAFGPSIPIDDPTFCFGENDLRSTMLKSR